VTNGDMENGVIKYISTGSGTETFNYTLNTSNVISGNYDALLQVTSTGTNQLRPVLTGIGNSLDVIASDKLYISFLYKVNSGTVILHSIFNGTILINVNNTFIGNGLYSRIITVGSKNNDLLNLYFNGTNLFSIQLDNYFYFNISTLIANEQYSPLYETTFDLMNDAEIKSQMDNWVIYPQYFIDYTTLGIDNLTQFEIQDYYSLWQQNNAYIEGYNQGELDGYAEGLEDNTAYVQGYNVGYTDGLLGGADMETGSSIIVLVLAALSFAFMLFGFTSRKRIFNLFAVGLFIVLGGLLFEYPAFIIVTIGFVIVNLYYTFVSD
jgi:hypothetical protein